MGASSVAGIGLQENGAAVLAKVALHYFGGAGKALLAIIVFLACLTTSVGLITACAEYFNRILPRVSYFRFATLFTVISCLLANVGLSAIVKLSLPMLMLLYPLTIALILLAFLHRIFGGSRIVYVATMSLTGIAGLFDAAKIAFGFSPETVAQISHWLPYYDIGLGWLVPGAVGLAIGLLLHLAGVRLAEPPQQPGV